MKRQILTAAAIVCGTAGALLAWEAPWSPAPEDRFGPSVLRPLDDEDKTPDAPGAIRQSPEWRSCANRLDAGDPGLTREVAHMQDALGLSPDIARQSVLVVCTNDLLAMQQGAYRESD